MLQLGFDGQKRLLFEAEDNQRILTQFFKSEVYYMLIAPDGLKLMFPDFYEDVMIEIKKICYTYQRDFIKRSDFTHENMEYVNKMFNEIWDKQQIILTLINQDRIKIIDNL